MTNPYNLPDEEVLQGFKNFDPWITKEYFYTYCRNAYNSLDNRYGLKQKKFDGFDFYSLAHDYYIRLVTENFASLEKRPKGEKLRAWMLWGFRFVILDALKVYNHRYKDLSIVEPIRLYNQIATTSKPYLIENIMRWVKDAYQDPLMDDIANKIFVLGYKQKEVAEELGLTPSAVSQRFKRMMDEVIVPHVYSQYPNGLEDEFRPAEEPSNTIFFHKAPLLAEEPAAPYNRGSRTTPVLVTELADNQIFVFGSDKDGLQLGSSAQQALKFGAAKGVGVGLQGKTYAIPTLNGNYYTVEPHIRDFIKYAGEHPELEFLVVEIGCGIAGYNLEWMAEAFEDAKDLSNISLPKSFWDVLD